MELARVDKIYACTTQKIPEVIPGIGRQQAEIYVRKMYEHPDFCDGVVRPTQKTTIVKLNRFMDFMQWMDDNKFK